MEEAQTGSALTSDLGQSVETTLKMLDPSPLVSSPVFFWIFAGVALVAALSVVLKKNPVSSAFSLVLVFFSFSGIYALMQAHLIAALQIFVYAGAVMVLFVFVIMLLNADVPSLDLKRTSIFYRLAVVAFLGCLFSVLGWTFLNSDLPNSLGGASVAAVEASGGNVQVLAELLFSSYILPFELTSALLLAAIVAAVAIAKRKPKKGGVSS